MPPRTRLAVLCDFREEQWPSMDIVAEMLIEKLVANHADALEITRVEPPFRRRFSRLKEEDKRLFNADRLVNRLWEYPRAFEPERSRFDLFHVADHSYGFLARALPPSRTGVFCHDLDTFKPLFEPGHRRWARLLARYTLEGMQRAAVVFYSTEAVRVNIERLKLIPNERLVHAPYGVSPVFGPNAPIPSPAPEYFGKVGARPFVLHVGSCIPRKRIDVLLDLFAAARAEEPELLLVQVGGTWTPEQERQIAQHRLDEHLIQVRGIPNEALAALYARAKAVLLTSEAEGFGLPVVEALSGGAPVIASDLQVTREVGGDAVVYAPVADVPAWSAAVLQLVRRTGTAPPLDARLARGAKFSWARHAAIIAGAYARLLGREPVESHAVSPSRRDGASVS